MRKVLIQGTITVMTFLAAWFIIDQVDWMKFLRIEKNRSSLEEKLGKIFSDVFTSHGEVDDGSILNTVDSLLSEICIKNSIPKDKIRLHIIENSDINAFALPDHHLVIFTGLLEASENQEELCGVICHELAHIESGHVMKKLLREAGLQMLVSMTGAGGGQETVSKTAKLLSSTAFDRNMEAEADRVAVEYMQNAEIAAEPFATFLYRCADSTDNLPGLTWISTHPDASDRAMKILEYAGEKEGVFREIISNTTWMKMKEALQKL